LELPIGLGNLSADKIANKYFVLGWIFKIHCNIGSSGVIHSKIDEFLNQKLAALFLFYLEIFIPISNKKVFKKFFKGSHIWLDFSDIGVKKSARNMGFIRVLGCILKGQKKTINFRSGVLKNRFMVILNSVRDEDPGE
jgi:hypothetical protein